MAEGSVIRPLSEQEKSEVNEISMNPREGLDLDQQFRFMLGEQEQVAVKKKLPFARKLAYDDFEDKKAFLAKEYQRSGGKTGLSLKDFNINWSKYSDLKNFDKLEDSDAYENKLIDGMKVSVKVGVNRNYRVKNTVYRNSVFLGLDDLK